MASTAVDELTTILGVDLAKDAMTKIGAMQKGLTTLRSTVMGLSVVFTGVAAASGFFTNRVGGDAEGLKTLADKTGLSTDALQEWRYAAESVGAGAGTIEKDLEGLQKKFLMTGKSAERTLLDLADRMKGMSGPRAQRLGEAYGLSDDTIKLLRQGKDGIAALRAEAVKMGHVISPEDLERARALNVDVRGLTMNLRAMATQALLGVVPAFSGMVAQARAWVAANRDWLSLRIKEATQGIVDGFQKFMDVLGDLKKRYLDPLLERMDPFIDNLGGWKQVISDLVSGALLGLLLILAPLVVKIMAAAGVILLLSAAFNDLLVYIKGGDSAIGRFIEKMKEFYRENKSLVDGLLITVSTFIMLKAAVAVWASLAKGTAVIKGIAAAMKALNVVMKANVFIALASAAIAALYLIYDNWDGISAWFAEKWEAVKELFPNFGAWAEDSAASIRSIFGKVLAWLKEKLTNILPGWAKKLLGIGGGEGGEGDAAQASGDAEMEQGSSILAGLSESLKSVGGFFSDIKGFFSGDTPQAMQKLSEAPMNQSVMNNSKAQQDNRKFEVTNNFAPGTPASAAGEAVAALGESTPHYVYKATVG